MSIFVLFSISGAPVSRRRYVNIENCQSSNKFIFISNGEQLLCRDHFCLEESHGHRRSEKAIGDGCPSDTTYVTIFPIPDFSPTLKKTQQI